MPPGQIQKTSKVQSEQWKAMWEGKLDYSSRTHGNEYRLSQMGIAQPSIDSGERIFRHIVAMAINSRGLRCNLARFHVLEEV